MARKPYRTFLLGFDPRVPEDREALDLLKAYIERRKANAFIKQAIREKFARLGRLRPDPEGAAIAVEPPPPAADIARVARIEDAGPARAVPLPPDAGRPAGPTAPEPGGEPMIDSSSPPARPADTDGSTLTSPVRWFMDTLGPPGGDAPDVSGHSGASPPTPPARRTPRLRGLM